MSCFWHVDVVKEFPPSSELTHPSLTYIYLSFFPSDETAKFTFGKNSLYNKVLWTVVVTIFYIFFFKLNGCDNYSALKKSAIPVA